MRILVAHNRYQIRGGEDVAVDGEIEALTQAGVDVVARIVTNDAVRVLSAKLNAALGAARSPAGVRLVREAIRETQPDVLHVHNFFPLISPAVHAAAHAEGVATVQTLHNFRTVCAGGVLMRDGRPCEICIGASPFWGAWHACYRGSTVGSLAVARMIDAHRRAGTWLNDVDRFVAMSDFARERFVRAGFPAEKITVKPNSVDDPGEPRERERSGIVYAGRLSEEKGVRVLIEAARRTTARIVVIGEGPLAGELQAGAPANVLFRGPLPRAAVRERIGAAEALVVPSVCYEGSPMVIAEAFAAATPVVASRIGALAGLVEDGRTGLQAAPGDDADLAEKLDCIIANKALARLMGRRARAQYEAEWSPRANVATLMRVYAEALAAFRSRGREEPALLALEPMGGDRGA